MSKPKRGLGVWIVCEHGREKARCCADCFRRAVAHASTVPIVDLAHLAALVQRAIYLSTEIEEPRDAAMKAAAQAIERYRASSR